MSSLTIPKNSNFNQIRKFFILFVLVNLFLSNPILSQESDLISKIYALNESVSDPSKQVGNLNPDSLPSLPIGLVKEIGGRKYIIAIDSAEFTPEGAYFDAYMAMELPDSDEKIAFAAKHIKFNPKGVLGGEQAKLQLVSDHHISMGPNTELFLPGSNGKNYVEWGCNGFESVNLNGIFNFSDGILVPDSSSTDSLVTAEFEVHVNDVQNIMAEVNFSPFQIRGGKGFVFTIDQAYVDLSDFNNPPSMVIPVGYDGANTPDWRGFYLKSFTVKLPSELEKGGQPTSIYAQDMLIDDAGVSGRFGALNLYTTKESDINGWGFSINKLEVQLTVNQITGGQLKGGVDIPALDETTLMYDALVTSSETSEEVNYNFTISADESVTMNCFKSTLELYPSSNINVQKIEGEFKPTLTLNGNLELTESVFKLKGVGFEQVTLVTEAPYITNGLFSLTSDDASNNLSKFPISVSNILFGIDQGQVVLGADVALNLSGQNSTSGDGNSFSCGTSLRVYSKTTSEVQYDLYGSAMPQKLRFEFDKLTVNTIHLEVHTNAFELDGMISLNKNDPVYGNGFYGQLSFRIEDVIDPPLYLGCAFGKKDDYKYFFVDASVPVNIPCGQVALTSLMGGISKHMVGQTSTSQMITQISNGTATLDGSSQVYIPDANTGLAFRAGVGLKYITNEKAFNGDVLFSIVFNANGGLSEIALIGDAYMMVKRNERKNASKYVKGTVSILYDNVEKILDAQASCIAQFSGTLSGSLWSQIYISPEEWFIKLGTPTNPASLNVANLATVNAYLMLGQNLPPMPAPPYQVQQIFQNANLGSQRDDAAIVLGDGIATGMNFNVSFDKRIGINDDKYSVYGMGSAGAGFDMTLFNYGPNAHCSGSSDQIGLKGWYLNGQLYSYFMLNMGVTGRAFGNDFDIKLLEASAALLLQGKLPKPTFVNGAVALRARVLSLFNVNLNFDFEFGNDCTIIQG